MLALVLHWIGLCWFGLFHIGLLQNDISVVCLKPEYIWIIYQARGYDSWILAKFFLACFMDRGEIEVHKHAKKHVGCE